MSLDPLPYITFFPMLLVIGGVFCFFLLATLHEQHQYSNGGALPLKVSVEVEVLETFSPSKVPTLLGTRWLYSLCLCCVLLVLLKHLCDSA